MTDTVDFVDNARADVLEAESDHNRWALHEFAFEYETKPPRFRNYHSDRIIDGEERPGYYDEFIPVAFNTEKGQIVGKNVEYKTTYCPDCEVAARKVDGESVCPECGLICIDAGPSHEIIRDGKAAGRTDGHNSN